MHIAIIGAGMGGLTAASLLADQGHDVTVFDRFDTPKPVGSGLVIQPVGQDVLAQVGALETALQGGNKITRMLGSEARSGRQVLDVSYNRNNPAAYGLAIHRATLFDALWSAVAARTRVKVVPSTTIVSTHQTADKIWVSSVANSQFGPFDLAINASGAGSDLSPIRAKPLAYGAIWGTVEWPDTALPRHHLSQRYVKASHMIGVLPLGTLPQAKGHKAALFWSLPANAYDAWRQGGTTAWQKDAIALWPDLSPFIEQIQDPDQMTMARYSHGTLKTPHAGRLVHIGDAAHRASPQLGQGANMALLDAAALARALSKHPVPQALPAYARARRLHTFIYQAMSWAFTPMYQSHSKVLPILRDRVLFPASRLPPAQRLLTSLVCGAMVNPLGRL